MVQSPDISIVKVGWIVNYEPPLSADDTRPRSPIAVPNEPHGDPRPVLKKPPLTTVYDDTSLFDAPSRPGCASPLLVVFTLAALLALFIGVVGLAAAAGYRDGRTDSATRAAGTQIALVATQRIAIGTDSDSGNYELLLVRCQYVAAQVPGDVTMRACIATAAFALSATPTMLPASPTLPAATRTSTPTRAPSGTPASTGVPVNSGDPSLPDLFAQAQTAVTAGKVEDLERARDLLEALRGVDIAWNQRQVEPLLCGVYESLGNVYDSARRLSEMVIVISKALTMTCRLDPSKSWAFTVNAAQLYLTAKGYLDAGNYPQAIRVYKRMMDSSPTFQDTSDLACEAFRKGGDNAAVSFYKCG